MAHVARTYDRGYGHFTTRQNIQYNWPKLGDVPDLLADLATVEMHAIQTSGNCIRNTTSDQYAGVAADELEDPRVYCELIRQWSTLHPEFTFLPRKFKIAVTGAPDDRAAVKFHDIGIMMHKNDDGDAGFEIMVGGGLGRSPYIAEAIREFLPKEHLLSYLEAVLRVYNQLGRRDNKYKARIKILLAETGAAEFTRLVEEEWAHIKDGALTVPSEEVDRINAYFAPPAYDTAEHNSELFEARKKTHPAFAMWVETNIADHKQSSYAIVNLSLKPIGGVPGDITASQMDTVADLADTYSFGEIRATHEQNLVFADVKRDDLYDLWLKLGEIGLATANLGLVTDMITCPGLDYCALANARSIPVAQEISERFANLNEQHRIGDLKLKISGCINACGHHHAGAIGILGVDRKGEELYQITLGGHAGVDASIGKVIGPAFSAENIVGAVSEIVETYLEIRTGNERLIDTYRRVGSRPFKEKLYGTH
jgi:sulfite reductase (NADPH) hemoprotein beta-component